MMSVITVVAPLSTNSCRCQKDANGPAVCSSSKDRGGSKCVIFDVSLCRTPRCVASHVTTSPRPRRSDATGAVPRAGVRPLHARWADTLRARSKQSSAGAWILVSIRIVPRRLFHAELCADDRARRDSRRLRRVVAAGLVELLEHSGEGDRRLLERREPDEPAVWVAGRRLCGAALSGDR